MCSRKIKSRERFQNNSKRVNFKTALIFFTVLIAILSIIFLNVRKNRNINIKNAGKFVETQENDIEECERLRYWSIVIEEWLKEGSLRTMNRVFKRMNYNFVNASNGDDWDILWAMETPWGDKEVDEKYCDLKNKKLLPHQKVNHFPGIFAIVNKAMMSYINRDFDFILPAFYLRLRKPEFDEYVKQNPGKTLVQKNLLNRGVKIIKVKDIDTKSKEIFYQEFMDNPFLIDGHAFDFGVFVLITSFDPIRAYRYSDDVLLRFCNEKYFPFNPNNRNKYVVKDGSLHVTNMPSFKNLYKNYSFSSKIIFENLISQKGFNVKEFWTRIDFAIAKVVSNAEKYIIEETKKFNSSSHHFFELVRFDIILNENLKPYVVEVNMSPNLTPAQKSHEENALIYEQLIHNVVKIIGGGSYHEFWSRFDSTDTIVSNRKNLATLISKCLEYDCINNCNNTYCQICHPCMTNEIKYQLSEAFREHQHAASFKRVFPVAAHFNDEKFVKKMTKNNQDQMRWWRGKCEDDKRWC